MAVFNTAFGALPQYKDITGMDDQKRRRQPTVEEQQPRDFGQQYRAQQQAQQAKPAAPAQTFAQMQAAGQARPAPPMMEAAAPPPPMLSQLRGQLEAPPIEGPAGPPAPPPVVPPPTTPPTTPPPTTPPPAAPPATPPAAAPTTFTDRSGTVWNRTGNTWTPSTQFGAGGFGRRTRTAGTVETDPATGLPRMNVDQGVINAYLPEEVFQAPDGNVWVKRGNNWVLEEGNEALSGYGALRPAGLPTDSARSGLSASGVDQFLRKYGTPKTPAQREALMRSLATDATRLGAGDSIITPSQVDAAIARIDAGAGGDGSVAVTPPPPFRGEFGGGVVGAGGRTSGGAVDRATGGAAGLPGEFGVGQGTLDLQKRLSDILLRMEGAPSPYDSEAYKAAEAAARADLEAQYGASRMSLEEQLARQGLSASTFGAGRYGDLAGQQARALSSMRADLLREAANQQAERQDVLLRSMAGLSGQMSEQDIAQFRANLDRFNIGTSLENQLKEILQRGEISKNQISAQLLSALLPQLDLSALSPEQLTALFKQYGLDLSQTPVTPRTTPTTPQTPQTPQTTTPGNTLNILQIPQDLSPYPEGQMFNYNGVILRKQGGILIDVATGQPYRTELI